MRLTTLTTLSLFSLFGVIHVLADTTLTTTQVTCTTSYASTSISSVPTTSSTSTRSDTYSVAIPSTFTPIFTLTPTVYTITSTSQLLSLKKETVTPTRGPITTISTQTYSKKSYSTTIIITSTIDGTSTKQSTVVFTKTGGSSVTVTPVLDTLPGAGPPANPRKRDLENDFSLNPRQNSLQPLYPNSVFCLNITRTIVLRQSTVTGGPVSTYTGPASIVYKTTTTTKTTTSTYYASNTFSTTTSTTIVTATVPLTYVTTFVPDIVFSTSTFLVAVATGYPQCLQQNQVLTVEGVLSHKAYILGSRPANAAVSEVRQWFTPASGVEDCCSACLDDPTCSSSLYYTVRYAPYALCQMNARANGVCDASNPLQYEARLSSQRDIYIAANGKCGQWTKASDITQYP